MVRRLTQHVKNLVSPGVTPLFVSVLQRHREQAFFSQLSTVGSGSRSEILPALRMATAFIPLTNQAKLIFIEILI